MARAPGQPPARRLTVAAAVVAGGLALPIPSAVAQFHPIDPLPPRLPAVPEPLPPVQRIPDMPPPVFQSPPTAPLPPSPQPLPPTPDRPAYQPTDQEPARPDTPSPPAQIDEASAESTQYGAELAAARQDDLSNLPIVQKIGRAAQ